MNRIVTYSRSSSGSEDIVKQRKLLARAAAGGLEVVGEFADLGAPGQGLDAAVASVMEGKADALAVVSLDRLSRKRQSLDQVLGRIGHDLLIVLGRK